MQTLLRYRHGGDLKIGSYPGASLASTIQRETDRHPRAKLTSQTEQSGLHRSVFHVLRCASDMILARMAMQKQKLRMRRYTKNLRGSRRSWCRVH